MSTKENLQGSCDDSVAYVLRKLEKNRIAVLATCGTDMKVSATPHPPL